MPDGHTVRLPPRDPFEDTLLERALVDGVHRAEANLPHAPLDGGNARILHFDDAARIFIEGLALLRERDVARIPPQQFDEHLPLKIGNAVGDGGLRDKQAFRNTRKIFQFDKHQKGAQVFRVHDSFFR